LKKNFVEKLTPLYGNNEASQFFYLLCEHYLGFSKVDISLNFDYELPTALHLQFQKAAGRLLKQEPIQYIIGTTYFYGNTFKVTPATLIPRPETEELVDWIITDHPKTSAAILDIGTGSGCIAISLAKELLNTDVSAIDFSSDALAIAATNASQIGASIHFVEQDILSALKLKSDYEIIVSNPPYVRELEKKEMSSNVLDFEPNSALFVSDNDPLIFYRKIAELIVASYLNSPKKRFLYYEINEYLADETVTMLSLLGFHSIEIKNDFRNKPRMLKAVWK